MPSLDQELREIARVFKRPESINELIRDITKAGFMSKSEVRRRINKLLAEQREQIREEIEGLPTDLKVNSEYDSAFIIQAALTSALKVPSLNTNDSGWEPND